MKCMLCLGRQVPITNSDTGAGDPNLSYLVRVAWKERFRINNPDRASSRRVAATHRRGGGGIFQCIAHLVARESRSVQLQGQRHIVSSMAGNQERGFRQTVARSKGLCIEAGLLESCCKTVHCGGTDRFSSVECHFPTAQV